MILYDNTLISLDIFKVKFCCDLPNCSGLCCIEGDSGAPLEPEETDIISSHLEKIKPFMNPEFVHVLDKEGFMIKDPDGDFCTRCIENKDCIFSYKHKGIYRCAIETAYRNKEIDFIKPISCHLYPIRLRKIKNELITVNYHEWSICKPALVKGHFQGKPMFRFLKAALIRRFGENWYEEMENIYKQLKEENQLQ